MQASLMVSGSDALKIETRLSLLRALHEGISVLEKKVIFGLAVDFQLFFKLFDHKVDRTQKFMMKQPILSETLKWMSELHKSDSLY